LKKIRLLTVVFDTEIAGHEIPAFRGAVIEKVGGDNILFHNHLEGKQFLYKYPLIQYKRMGRKPALICIDYGVDEIHKFFEKKDWNLKISDRWLEMKIDKLQMNQFVMQVWDKTFNYSISNWIALNQENHIKYQELEAMTARIEFLERTLKANILSFAKGIDWTVDKEILLSIKDIRRTRSAKVKGKYLVGFDLDFTTNVFLPNFIGLGKSVSLGYGVVSQKRIERN
jgi:hypothetical protein